MLIVSYALLGPLLGAITFWSMTFALPAIFSGHADTAVWSSGIKLLSIYMQYSYLVGFLPAVGAGICHVIVRRKLNASKARVIFVALIGASLVAVLFGITGNPVDLYETTLPMVAAGGSAAFLIAMGVEFFALKRDKQF